MRNAPARERPPREARGDFEIQQGDRLPLSLATASQHNVLQLVGADEALGVEVVHGDAVDDVDTGGVEHRERRLQ